MTEPFRSFVYPVIMWDLPLGEVVAVVQLVDCVRITAEFGESLTANEQDFGDYTPGRFAWILKDVKPLAKPIPAKGSLGLWHWDNPCPL